ncbi:unnamed protein product [Amoebophrya sp. A25]|nr:unnamed protein product [Amoebophrya sp. A25]|eukprot:GSA25T00004094001.1
MSRITDAYSLLVDPKRRREFDHSAAASGASEEASGTQEQQASGFGDFGGSSGIGVEQEWVDPSQLYSEFSNIFGKMASRAGRGGRGGPAPARGDDASVELKVSFHEAMRGARRRIQLKLQLPCNDCGASGAQAGSGWSKCPMCNGTGVRRVERGIMSMGLPCAKCGGVGDLLEHACETCSGEGVVSRKVEVEVEIPPGIKPGMELRLPGQGHAGARGGRRGHLFVLVNVESHPKFRHIDDDLHADVDVSLRTMLLGGKVKVPTLEGDVDLNLPPLNEPSSTRILRGKGPTRISGGGSNSKASNSGNLILHFGLKLPHSLTEEQKRLIHAFDQIEREKTTANEDTKTDPDTSSARPSAAGTSSFSSTTTSTHSRNDASSCRSENIEQVGEHDQSSSSSFRGSMATRRMASASKNW